MTPPVLLYIYNNNRDEKKEQEQKPTSMAQARFSSLIMVFGYFS